MSECFCLLITLLRVCWTVLWKLKPCAPSSRTWWGQFPRGHLDRLGQNRPTAKCPLPPWDEVSQSAVMESVLIFQYHPVPAGRALIFHSLYEVVSYYILQIFNFVANFTTFSSFHIIPCPGHLYTRFRCTIWEAVCGWLGNPHIQLLASRF